MRKQNRSCSMLTTAKSRYHFDTNKIIISNKRGYSAEGYSLLTSALRPRLCGGGNCNSKSISYLSTKNKSSNNLRLQFSREKLAFTIPIISVTVLAIISLFQNNANVSATSATLTIPDAVFVNVNPTLNDGFAESTPGEVSVSTGNLGGYTLSIKSKNNSNDLVNELDSNAKLVSITTELSTEQYRTGDYVNTWGFKPDYVDSSPNTSYRPGPDTNGIVLAKTNSDSALDNINLAIAAKVDSNTITGNYTNTFVLTAVPNEAKYTIKYDATSLSGATNASSFPTESNIITGDTQVINSAEPTKSGTDFLGWCDEPLQSDGSCKGSVIQAGGNLRMCKCNTDVTLYAMWGTKPTTQVNGTSCSYIGIQGYYYEDICWMWKDYKSNIDWNAALTTCPAPWRLPTKNEFQILSDYMGTGPQLHNAGWSNGYYWSPDKNENSSGDVYELTVGSTYSGVSYTHPYLTGYVRCVVR